MKETAHGVNFANWLKQNLKQTSKQPKPQNLNTALNTYEYYKISAHLNRLGVSADHFAIHFFASSRRRRCFGELNVANPPILLRQFIFHDPDILDPAKMFKRDLHVFRCMSFTTDDENTREWRIIYVYTSWNWSWIHGLLVVRSHVESFESSLVTRSASWGMSSYILSSAPFLSGKTEIWVQLYLRSLFG